MFHHPTLQRVLIIAFMIIVGYALGKAFYHNSISGIVLGFISLGAAVYFLYLLGKARAEMETEENG